MTFTEFKNMQPQVTYKRGYEDAKAFRKPTSQNDHYVRGYSDACKERKGA